MKHSDMISPLRKQKFKPKIAYTTLHKDESRNQFYLNGFTIIMD